MHLSAPKTHHANDLALDEDTPIFCTSNSRIRYVSQCAINERETKMMEVRWKVFSVWKQIPESGNCNPWVTRSCNPRVTRSPGYVIHKSLNLRSVAERQLREAFLH